MTSIRNKVLLIGRLGGDPDIVSFDSGKRKASFSLATSDMYKDAKGEKITETQWHNIVLWGKIVDVVEKYLHKGNEVAIDGRIVYRSYEDKSGDKKFITEIVVNDLVMVGGK